MLSVCIPGSNKLKGNEKMTLVYTWKISDFKFYSHLEREEKRDIWKKSQANIVLESRDLRVC